MIRATGTDSKGHRFLILGVDRQNIDRLTSGKPIHVKGETVGLPVDVWIVFGETLQLVTDELVAAGVVLPTPAKPDA